MKDLPYILGNIMTHCAFLAAMCFCIKTEHVYLAAWCLVGAIVCGYVKSGKKDDESEDEE